MNFIKKIACVLPRVGLTLCASVAVLFAQPAIANRIGDWQTSIYADDQPFAIVNPTLNGPGDADLKDFKIECDGSAKLKFQTVFAGVNVPKKLILDNPTLDEFSISHDKTGIVSEIVGKDAERLMAVLLKEEQASRAAGAKSWTLTFFIDDPKTAGYSANVGGTKEVRDFMLKSCAAPADTPQQAAKVDGPKPQSDRYLASQPFLAPNRTHALQFYESGMYQIMNIRAARGKSLEWQGSYTISSNMMVLDPDTPKQISCGFRYTPQKDFVLSNCQHAGTFVAMQNVR